jgi:hypothetical protein
MKIHPEILGLLHAYAWTSQKMTFNTADCGIKDDDVIKHAQTMGNGVLIVPPHDFEH